MPPNLRPFVPSWEATSKSFVPSETVTLPSTVNPVNVPTLVIAVWAAPVTVAALPVVFWLPAVFTPGKLISALPSNDTPPIVLAVARAVAVAAFPVVSWLPVAFTPGKLISALPSNDTPPIYCRC